jgi:hypothetical protein
MDIASLRHQTNAVIGPGARRVAGSKPAENRQITFKKSFLDETEQHL